MAGVGSGYASAPHDTVEKVVSFISTTQIIRSAVLLLGFIFAVVSRRLWFGADMIATGLAALVFILAPQILLDFQISRQALDGVDLQMARLLGCVLLGNSVLWFLTTKYTKDPDTVHSALLFTRVITNGVLLIAMIDVQLFTKSWGIEHLTFGILGVSLWLIGNLAHLIRGGYHGGHGQRGRPMNSFLLCDFAISVFVGFALYGFPRWFLRNFTLVRTIDGAHEHLARAFGTALFGTGLFAFQAVGFADDKDKEAHFIQRLVINSLLMLSTLYAQVFYYREWNLVSNWAVQFGLVLWTIHAYLGWKADPFQIRYAGTRTKTIIRDRERFTTRSPGSSRNEVSTGIRSGLVPDYGDYDRED